MNGLGTETIRLVKALKSDWKTILLEGLELKKKEKMWMKEQRLLKNGTWDQMSFIGKLGNGMNTTETNTWYRYKQVAKGGKRGQIHCPHPLPPPQRETL